jgi:phospholipase C
MSELIHITLRIDALDSKAMTLTRRRLLRDAGLASAALAAGLPGHLLEALAAPPRCGRLMDVEHIVVLIQENRSFDHYFGTRAGVRGYSDPNALPSVFRQVTPPGTTNPPDGYLLPFRLNRDGATQFCTSDITHDWGPQHRSWNGGRMDSFASVHIDEDPNAGVVTMGYYERADTPFYYAVADAFTVLDGYHCSVIGPTDPNRLYSMSAWLGQDHDPLLTTLTANRQTYYGRFTWPTFPERLQESGVNWKVYGSQPDATEENNVLRYFRNYQDPASELYQRAFLPSFPGTFQADCAAGTLPQVSWLLAPLVDSEHPPAPPSFGEDTLFRVLSALTSNPGVWAKTALVVTYDENGGFFDHVPPTVPPAGTPGEFLSVSPLPAAADGIPGPIGLGFRVPTLLISPFSRGGFVCSDTFDHTSTLKLIDARFRVGGVPNLTSWRNQAVGDLVSAFNFAAPADTSIPPLPATQPVDPATVQQCATSGSGGSFVGLPATAYPVPEPQAMPGQEAGSARRPRSC